MKTCKPAIVILIATLLAAAQSMAAQSGPDISSVREEWEKAWNEKNLTEVLGLYADDAVLLVNGKPITGRDNIENHFKEIIKDSSDLKLTTNKTNDSGKGTHDSGSVQYTLTRMASVKMGSGTTLKIGAGTAFKIGTVSRQVEGDYLMILKREKGKWLIVEHAWNEAS
jgi:ketosteroid isomerase-like protein